jgi:lipase chaperone LimK
LAYFEDRSEGWVARVDQFNTDRNRVRDDSSLSEDQKQSTIKQMKSNEFSNKEIFKLAYQNIKQRNIQVN